MRRFPQSTLHHLPAILTTIQKRFLVFYGGLITTRREEKALESGAWRCAAVEGN